MRLAKALIRLGVCPGWSEPLLVAHTTLLVAHTTLLEISCRGSNMFQSKVPISKDIESVKTFIVMLIRSIYLRPPDKSE